MCGRFTVISDLMTYQLEFDLLIEESIKQNWQARYNISPGQLIPTVKDAGSRSLTFMKWGLVPAWAKDEKANMHLINIRAETILEKPTFRRLMHAGQRCFILADGFYEWQSRPIKGASKIPYYFHLKNGKPFAFAGLWEIGFNSEKQPITTCAIITCNANAVIASVHNRMPVIFNAPMAWEWLTAKQEQQLLALLKPYPDEELVAYPVSNLVNSPAVDMSECIRPATDEV